MGGTSELGAPPIRVLSETSSCIRGSCVRGQGPQPPLPSTRVVALGCAHACPSTWAPTSLSRRMFSSLLPAQRHAPRPLLPSSRADRHLPRIRACSQSRHPIRSNPSVKQVKTRMREIICAPITSCCVGAMFT